MASAGIWTAKLTPSLENISLNATTEVMDFCSLEFRKAEFPLILISTLLVNVLALIVLQRMRGTCDTLDHYLMSLLNLNDIITTGIFTFMWISGWASCNRLLQNHVYCAVFAWVGSALLVWSSTIILIMTSCRYLSLAKPLYYRARVTTATVTQGAVGSMLFCLLLFIFPFTGLTDSFVLYEELHICAAEFEPHGTHLGQRVFIGCIGVLGCATVAVVVVCNIVIVAMLRRHNAVHPGITSAVAGANGSRLAGSRRVFGHVTLVVSFVFALCYAPFVVRITVDCVSNSSRQDDLIHTVTIMLLFLSPLFNPIVYGVFNKHFRAALLTLFRIRVGTLRNKARSSPSENVEASSVKTRGIDRVKRFSDTAGVNGGSGKTS